MPSHDPAQRSLHGRRAIAMRWGDTETAEITGRDLRALQLEEQIRRLVDAWPPLTPAQRDHLAGLLAGGSHV
jgi:hypothetical protein